MIYFRNKVDKHNRMKGVDGLKPFMNYFYYVVPQSMIPISECPQYAGLIYVRSIDTSYGFRYFCEQVKSPVRFHKDKVSEGFINNMLRSVMFKYYNMLPSYK